MPRQDVPYGGAICRLKERIAEIWDKLGEKLHSVNGVTGDAAGNVEIVSGDAAITISEDQVNHQIEIALDSSQLPAAAVSSVNGQTGVVVLDGDDIELTEGGVVSVSNAVITNGQRIAILQGDLNTEISDRQNADSALQGNINAALATIPGEVSSQIANNATIAQLVAADAQNVKLTGNQNIQNVKTVITETTGQYSQQIANSQKVRNEIANLGIMQTGNQTKTGNLLMYNNLNKRLVADWSTVPTANTATAYNFGYDDSSNRINVNQVYAGTDGVVQQQFILYDHDSTANVRLIFGLKADKKAFLGLRDTSGVTHIIFQES